MHSSRSSDTAGLATLVENGRRGFGRAIQQIHPGRKGPVLAPGKRCRNAVPGHYQQDFPVEPHGHENPRTGMLHHWSA
ncbi:hypothetical protein [Acidovorax facilis]|uniref:hypothetical protein n=1 Tax=Acidovorax facilis TaxID=12917 RepID=UPI003D65159B